tara:strand:- start:298 stop:831 length:534 start_codon:yes stop_codon:yes gene_type:complete
MGLVANDLQDRITPNVDFDEFSAKVGTDDDIVVASFKVLGQDAAVDLENFLEKGYEWIIDAETSPGEIEDGYYLVFVEAERRTSYPNNFMSMIGDLENLTSIDPTDWTMKYYQGSKRDPKYILSVNNIEQQIPLSPRKYRAIKQSKDMLEGMLNVARVPRKKGDINEFTTVTRRPRS